MDRWMYFPAYADENAEALAEIGKGMEDPDALQQILDGWAEWTEEEAAEYLPEEYLNDSDDRS